MRRLFHQIDIPPLWLVVAAAVVWGVSKWVPVMLPGGRHVGLALIALGVMLMVLAGAQMLWHRTSLIPRRVPSAMVTDWAFGLSRNPIYLADTLILTGWMLWTGGIWAAPVVIVFSVVITRRFILPEEAELALSFGEDFDRYRARVRRWL